MPILKQEKSTLRYLRLQLAFFLIFYRKGDENLTLKFPSPKLIEAFFVLGNIFISRKSIVSCEECDEDEGLTPTVIYKIGTLTPKFFNI